MAKSPKPVWPLITRSFLLLIFLKTLAGPTWAASPKTSSTPSTLDEGTETSSSKTETEALESLKTLQENEVVITASKSEEKTTEVLGSTTIITSTEIKVGASVRWTIF